MIVNRDYYTHIYNEMYSILHMHVYRVATVREFHRARERREKNSVEAVGID